MFADIGFADAGERQAKMRLRARTEQKPATCAQVNAAQTARLFSAETSALHELTASTAFSVERVMDFLASLDRDVEIVIRPRSVGAGAGPNFRLSPRDKVGDESGFDPDCPAFALANRRRSM
ncbi:MAG: XRE family transcriptional regulator [Rhizomicrobium sp.]